MSDAPLSLFLADEAASDRLAGLFAPLLKAGDTLLLEGQIGAGKTHFCRALIRARLGRMEDVPSPTFTLVQTYEADVDIWHADLYRLTHPDEVRELGLEEAFVSAICLVEWPDRLGDMAPDTAIGLRFVVEGAGRRVEISGARGSLRAALLRQAARGELLAGIGWEAAEAVPLAGDASARRYERLVRDRQSLILMDAPPDLSPDTADFVKIDRHLRGLGLSAPEIRAENIAAGFLVLEDFGNRDFASLIAQDPGLETPLYRAAADVLLALHNAPPAADLPDLSAKDWAEAAAMVLDWYRFAITGDKVDTGPFVRALGEAIVTHADAPRVMILRDYHAENLMWLPERQGVQRVGLLDFQLAQMGQRGYDLVSLLQDARRDVPPETEADVTRHFLKGSGLDAARFARSYAVLGAQRALRILGIFARLCLVGGKAQYVALIPRVWGQLQRNLARPELAELAGICRDLLPEPGPTALERISAQCGNFR